MTALLFVILHFLVCALFISGALLCLQRKRNKRPRIYLAIFSFVTGIELTYRLYVAHSTGTLSTVNDVLPIYVLITGVLEILLMYLYPLEVLRPHWLTFKKLFLLFLPWLLIGSVCIWIYPDFTNLSSFWEMMEHIGEMNVWFRLLILLCCFIPYIMLFLRIPYQWQQSSVDSKWIYNYVAGIQIIGLLFSAVVLTGSVVVSCIHLLYGMLFVLYVAYQELYLRLLPALPHEVISPSVALVPELPNPSTEEEEEEEAATCNPLWERLVLLMDEKELWRNPDLTLEDLARCLYTNRTKLSTLIQQQGYSGYSEFINRRRIKAFLEVVDSSNASNMLQIFYEAGFRSKSTALRNFRLYMGCTPSEYMQKRAEQLPSL